MPRLGVTRRLGPIGAALTLYDVWRRLSPKQRKWLVEQARMHGPRIARQAVDAQKRKRR